MIFQLLFFPNLNIKNYQLRKELDPFNNNVIPEINKNKEKSISYSLFDIL